MSRTRQNLGEIGENLACLALEQRGYAILDRRYRRRRGEIDIVALDGPTLVFVEVKARDGRDFGCGGESVTARKRRRLVDVALEYLSRHRITGRPCRFDVVSIEIGPAGPAIELYQNAFDVR
jgi:putative endonuclease